MNLHCLHHLAFLANRILSARTVFDETDSLGTSAYGDVEHVWPRVLLRRVARGDDDTGQARRTAARTLGRDEEELNRDDEHQGAIT